jgi:hypothetical protein
VAVGRPDVVPGLALERPGDHAPDRVLAGQDLAGELAAAIELVERDRLDVSRDLEDRVGRRIDDPLPRALVFLAELLDDLCPRGGLVAEHAAAGPVHERVEDLEGKPVRIGRKGLLGHHTHELPVAGGRVLPLRALEETAGDGRRAGLRRATLELLDVSEPERLQVRQVEAADSLGDVSERV